MMRTITGTASATRILCIFIVADVMVTRFEVAGEVEEVTGPGEDDVALASGRRSLWRHDAGVGGRRAERPLGQGDRGARPGALNKSGGAFVSQVSFAPADPRERGGMGSVRGPS